MRSARATLLTIVVALVLPSAVDAKLAVGIFAPEVPFSGPAARYAYLRGIAQHLSATLGVPVEALAYKRAADFARDVRQRKLQFAVAGAMYVASLRGTRILAVAKLRTSHNEIWSIMTKGKKLLPELKGKVLEVPSMGPLTTSFVQYGLLGGNVNVNKFFRLATAPDVSSAVSAVNLGQADAAVAPIRSNGLAPVMEGVRVPPPAFVLLDRSLPGKQVATVSKAILSYGGTGANLIGWQAGDIGPYLALTAASRKRTLQMVLVPTEAAQLRYGDLVDASKRPQAKLPELEDLFWVP